MKHWVLLIVSLIIYLPACSPIKAEVVQTATVTVLTTGTLPSASEPVQPATAAFEPALTYTPTLLTLLTATHMPSPSPEPTRTPRPVLAPIGKIQPIPDGLVYLGDPGALALGFNMNAGGAIGSLLFHDRELVDRTDYGRYIQLSFYDGGDRYGPLGNDPYGKWGWNPIQAGSKAGGGVTVGAKVLEYRTGEGGVYIKAQGIEWGKNKEDSDVIFETWAWQRQGYFEVYTRAIHLGEDSHDPATQEFPAAYFAKSLTRMFSYFGTAPFTADPISKIDHVAREGEAAGMDNCPFVYPTENWAAFGGDDGVGLILAVPPQPYLEAKWNFCRLYDVPPVGYIGPIAYFDVPPQAVREITYYLIPGPIESARGIVYNLLIHTTWAFDLNTFEGWQGASSEDTVANGILTAHLASDQFLTSKADLKFSGGIAPSVTIRARPAGAAEICLQFTTARDQEWSDDKSTCLQLSESEFQVKSFDLSENPAWKDNLVTRLRLFSPNPTTVEFDSLQVDLKGRAWEFESEGDTEGWMPWHQLKPFQVSQGILSSDSNGVDPYMGSPNFTLKAGDFHTITIRMAVSGGNSAQLFFITSSDPAYDEIKSITFPIEGDGEFHTYTLDMSAKRGWKGTITQLRLDPTAARALIQVDYIRILEP